MARAPVLSPRRTIVLVGLIAGARSQTTKTLTGLALGAYLGLMAGFPLLALGLATS